MGVFFKQILVAIQAIYGGAYGKQKYVVKECLYWSVGDVRNILLWDDVWLRRTISGGVTSSRLAVSSVPLAMVADLIPENQWNEEILNAYFNEQDHKAILSIPLPRNHLLDRVCWKFESKGLYSVKSAYKTISSSPSEILAQISQVWNKLWKLKIPPKLLHVVWRVLTGVLPCKQNLVKKRVPLDPACTLCYSSVEIDMHVLLHCPIARDCWISSSIGWQHPYVPTLMEWFVRVFLPAKTEEANLIAMMLWALWTSRNEVVWNNKYRRPQAILYMASRFYDDWFLARQCLNSDGTLLRAGREEANPIVWQRPPYGHVKVNVDASVRTDSTTTGLGCLARDEEGAFMGASTVCYRGQFDVKVA